MLSFLEIAKAEAEAFACDENSVEQRACDNER